jgi:DNA repair protein RadC
LILGFDLKLKMRYNALIIKSSLEKMKKSNNLNGGKVEAEDSGYRHPTHRKNMRGKFAKSECSPGDYELLEMFLFLPIPRKNTREIAKNLLRKFGNLNNVMNADRDRLLDVDGLGEVAVHSLRLFHEITLRISRAKLKESIVNLDRLAKVVKYCKIRLGHIPREETLALFLNNSMKLVGEASINIGTRSGVAISKSLLIARAELNGAAGVIIAHNHPSGNPNPSVEDLETTEEIRSVLESVGLKLVDHIIVAENKSFSFSSSGLLPPFV